MEEEGINAFIHSILLYRWPKEYREGKFKVDKRKKKVLIEMRKVTEIMRIQQLERENQRLRIENELLKKTIEFNTEIRQTSLD